MPEIDKCRKCAGCCSSGCIFLSYSDKEQLFSCLIYKNKHRFPTHMPSLNHCSMDELLSDIFSRLKNICEETSSVCHSYTCAGYIGQAWKDDIPLPSFRDADIHKIIRVKENMENTRKIITDFDTLIEILNS